MPIKSKKYLVAFLMGHELRAPGGGVVPKEEWAIRTTSGSFGAFYAYGIDPVTRRAIAVWTFMVNRHYDFIALCRGQRGIEWTHRMGEGPDQLTWMLRSNYRPPHRTDDLPPLEWRDTTSGDVVTSPVWPGPGYEPACRLDYYLRDYAAPLTVQQWYEWANQSARLNGSGVQS
jgi:hypothetical protein